MKRPRHPMPDFIRIPLESNNLMGAYQARPPYQQNDYIGWIMRAKHPKTQQKRLAQMIEELKGEDTYMMEYHVKKPGHP